MSTNTVVWATARASGIATLMLLSASVLLGLAMSTNLFGRRLSVAWRLDLHRFLGATAIVFLGVHVGSILLDGYVHFGLVNVLVPLTGNWHPDAVAAGIAAFYLLLSVELVSLARAHLPLRVWRASHYLSFPLLLLALIHGLTAGTDSRSPVLQATYVVILAAFAGLVAMRVESRRNPALQPATPPRAR
jgi:sulfoxide reductase heme-binding subunit YedZ